MAKEVDSIHLLSCAIEASLGNDFPAFAFRLPGEDGFSILKKLRNTPSLRRLPAPGSGTP